MPTDTLYHIFLYTLYAYILFSVFVRIYIPRELLTRILHTSHIPQRTTTSGVNRTFLILHTSIFTINIELHVEFPKAIL